MIWPADLKARVIERTGGVRGGLTEFTLEAVELHLKGEGAVRDLELELNETKLLAQLLADRIVMGGTQADRLEALMEVEFPAWMDTSGWPSEFAKRVPIEEIDRNARAYGYEVGKGAEPADVVQVTEGNPFVPQPDPEPAEKPKPEPTDEDVDRSRVEEGKRKAAEARARISAKTEAPAPETEPVPSGLKSTDRKDDLFARIAAKSGDDDMAAVLGKVTTASEISAPGPKPVEELSEKEQRYARQEAPEPRDDSTPEVPVTVITEMDVRPASQPIVSYAEGTTPTPPAAVIVEPEQSPVAICPNCQEELIDGECWTCG